MMIRVAPDWRRPSHDVKKKIWLRTIGPPDRVAELMLV